MDEQLWLRRDALLDVAHAFVKDLRDQAAEPMGDSPDGGLIAESWQQTPEDRLEMGSLAPGCGMSDLVEYSPHVLVALCRATGAVLFSALFLSGTGSYPGGF